MTEPSPGVLLECLDRGGGGGVAVCLLSPKSIFEFTLLMSDLCLTSLIEI